MHIFVVNFLYLRQNLWSCCTGGLISETLAYHAEALPTSIVPTLWQRVRRRIRKFNWNVQQRIINHAQFSWIFCHGRKFLIKLKTNNFAIKFSWTRTFKLNPLLSQIITKCVYLNCLIPQTSSSKRWSHAGDEQLTVRGPYISFMRKRPWFNASEWDRSLPTPR